MNRTIQSVTERIRERSRDTRSRYLERIGRASGPGPARSRISCGNVAHAFAASGEDKPVLKAMQRPNIGIVTAYNDMLSAHQPLERFPALIKLAARARGCTAQVAGGVPAMCDGVTQGQPGMELSLFSRDVIAQATAVSLSHGTFDAALLLGVCDKIVPGLIMAAGTFGYLPGLFVPAGPMVSGLPNDEKAKVRQQFAAGEVGHPSVEQHHTDLVVETVEGFAPAVRRTDTVLVAEPRGVQIRQVGLVFHDEDEWRVVSHFF